MPPSTAIAVVTACPPLACDGPSLANSTAVTASASSSDRPIVLLAVRDFGLATAATTTAAANH